MRVIKNDNECPIKIWAGEIEEGAMEQIVNLAKLPFVLRHIAIMPDVHQGYGMPIGGVLAAEGVVVPNAVGVDIGCGMCAVKTSIKVEEITNAAFKNILKYIRESIPVGFNHQDNKQDDSLMPDISNLCGSGSERWFSVVKQEYTNALYQLGTLGGGNHFIELQKDPDNNVWVMLHSGSRNLGYKVAKYYNDMAKKLNATYYSSVPKEWDLAFFPLYSNEGENYISEMNYCVDFAYENRKLMMERIKRVLGSFFPKIEFEDMLNIAHNYAAIEHHYNTNVVVHRKGATRARKGEIGIIPGSQGTPSYIVKGLGNKESFESCSHGAGRVMGRKEAIKVLNLEEEIARLDKQGIIHSIRTVNDLEEAPSAYKDIDAVMAEQKELVEIVVKLQPMAVIKG